MPSIGRCYMTLTTALHLHRGGSPKGPAGTGKTETVKDLGKALGIYVIVVNCSEGLDYKSMGRMYSGLAQVHTPNPNPEAPYVWYSPRRSAKSQCNSLLCHIHHLILQVIPSGPCASRSFAQA